MATQKNQPVSIIVSLGFPGNWTEEELCTYVGQLLLDYRPLRGHVLTVKGLSKVEEFQESTTASQTVSTGSCICNCSGSDNPANWGHASECCFWDDVRPR